MKVTPRKEVTLCIENVELEFFEKLKKGGFQVSDGLSLQKEPILVASMEFEDNIKLYFFSKPLEKKDGE